MPNRFSGIPASAFHFYNELEADNSKAFWAAHLTTFEEAIRGPMGALLAELSEEFGPGKLFRPNRDLRFGADKRPYKEHQGLFVRSGDANGFYAQISADGFLVGAGWYSGTSDQIARYRAAVGGPAGAELADALAELTTAGYEIAGDQLKSRPRGVPLDHPRLDLLRRRSLYVARSFPADTPWLATPQTLTEVRRMWRETSTLVDWLDAYVTGGPVAAAAAGA